MNLIVKDLKQNVESILSEKNGIILYCILKNTQELKRINIADESEQDSTQDDLKKGFVTALNESLAVLDNETEILKISSADERKSALYYYDLDRLPKEMELLRQAEQSAEDGSGNVFSFRKDKLEQIDAFIIVIGNAVRKIALYKQHYPVSLFKRDHFMVAPVPHSNRLKRVEQDILRIDFNYQFFAVNGQIYISDVSKMEKICSFHSIIKNEAEKSIKIIEKSGIVENVNALRKELDDVTFARKLTRIYKDSCVLGKVENKKIIRFVKKHKYFEKNPLKLNKTGDKFILDSRRAKIAFIKLLDDDLLKSELTENDYEVLAKNNSG